MASTKKLMPCVICSDKFSEQDVKNLIYFPSTGLCREEYEEAYKDKTLCFGKCFDKSSRICTSICKDTVQCKYFSKVKGLDDDKIKN